MSLLYANQLTKRFGGLTAVDSVTFEIEKGTITGLIGPNGAGKTTIFNLISGFIKPDGGELLFNSTNLREVRSDEVCRLGLSRTFQESQPFLELNVLENVTVGALASCRDIKNARRKAKEVLALVGIEDLRDRSPKNLTLFDLKRMELAKALATKPKLLLLDEMFSGLTLVEAEKEIDLIRRLRENGITIISISITLT